MRRGRKSAAQTPAPKSERIYGSKKNPKGSASSTKSAKDIKFSDKTIKSLEKKLKDFKKNHSNSRITLNDLKAVYRRGAGAYSSSHRPTITGGVPNTRNAWAMARVNKFLKKAAGEKVKAAYVQDDDLLKDGGQLPEIIPYEKPPVEGQPIEKNEGNIKFIAKDGGKIDKGLDQILFMENGGMATDYSYKYNKFITENKILAKGDRVYDDKELLKRYKSGENIGFSAVAHLKSEGLIERADGTKRKSAEDGAEIEGFKTPKTFEEIQEMHGTNPDYLLEQLLKGIEVEKEHTDNDQIAETIALHHLEERPDYYEILDKVEKAEPEFENNYYLWIIDERKQGEGYDFETLQEALNYAQGLSVWHKHFDNRNLNMTIRNYCGQKLYNQDEIILINEGKKEISEFKTGGEIPEIEEFLKNQKEEADAVLFSRKSKIMKYMICNSNIEYAEEQIYKTESDLEKNVWQQVKMIWTETKEEVDDMIFMYGEGGQPHSCSCQKYSKGGLAYGNSHAKGGMPMTVKSTGQKIEIEGGEGVVNKRTMQSSKMVNLNGKKMTPCEAVSKLNEMGGGVKFKCPDVKEIISKDGNF